MANKIFQPPIGGFSEGINVEDSPVQYSGYMNNVRPIDVLERKLRIGQRPGLDKKYTQQIAGVAGPIVCACSVSVVN